MQEREATYVVSVRVPVRSLAIIGRFLDESGLYREAKPSGALAYALKLFTSVLEGNELARPCDSLEDALVVLSALRYPMEQVSTQLSTQQAREDRKAQEQETVQMFGMPLKELAAIKKEVQQMSPAVKARLKEGLSDTEFEVREREKLAREKSNLEALLQAGGVMEEPA